MDVRAQDTEHHFAVGSVMQLEYKQMLSRSDLEPAVWAAIFEINFTDKALISPCLAYIFVTAIALICYFEMSAAEQSKQFKGTVQPNIKYLSVVLLIHQGCFGLGNISFSINVDRLWTVIGLDDDLFFFLLYSFYTVPNIHPKATALFLSRNNGPVAQDDP